MPILFWINRLSQKYLNSGLVAKEAWLNGSTQDTRYTSSKGTRKLLAVRSPAVVIGLRLVINTVTRLEEVCVEAVKPRHRQLSVREQPALLGSPNLAGEPPSLPPSLSPSLRAAVSSRKHRGPFGSSPARRPLPQADRSRAVRCPRASPAAPAPLLLAGKPGAGDAGPDRQRDGQTHLQPLRARPHTRHRGPCDVSTQRPEHFRGQRGRARRAGRSAPTGHAQSPAPPPVRGAPALPRRRGAGRRQDGGGAERDGGRGREPMVAPRCCRRWRGLVASVSPFRAAGGPAIAQLRELALFPCAVQPSCYSRGFEASGLVSHIVLPKIWRKAKHWLLNTSEE